jgi:hypothetical protein
VEEKPYDLPSSGSYDVTSALINSYPKGTSYMRDLFVPPFGEAAGSCCTAAGKGSACPWCVHALCDVVMSPTPSSPAAGSFFDCLGIGYAPNLRI